MDLLYEGTIYFQNFAYIAKKFQIWQNLYEMFNVIAYFNIKNCYIFLNFCSIYLILCSKLHHYTS